MYIMYTGHVRNNIRYKIMILKMNLRTIFKEKTLWNYNIFGVTSSLFTPSIKFRTYGGMKQNTRISSAVTANFLRILYAGILVISMVGNVNAKIGYFWHITDLHLDSFYSTKGDVLKSCWYIEHHQTSSSGRTPGRFGDYLCDSPWSLLESATLAMKSRQGDNVEFVLWTGDGLSHSAHRLLEKYRLEILRNITDLLGRTFSSQFVFPVLGHEDGSNTNFHRLGELWRHWLPSEALQTFEKGGYYTIEQTKSRLRIIALNTNFMKHDPKYSQSQLAAVRQRQSLNPLNSGTGIDSTEYKNFYYHHGGGHHYPSDISGGYGYSASSHYGSNSYGGSGGYGGINSGSGSINSNNNNNNNLGGGGSAGGQVSALQGYENHETQKQWDWLEDVLAKSNRNKETVYIVGHIPPGSDERIFGNHQQNGHSTYSEKNNLRYLRLVRKYSSIIQGQFFGHLHSDSFRIIYNDMGKPVSWIMISPSVTPRKMSVGSNNPAMRLYKFDTDSGQVLDYTQYYLDLANANSIGEANWMPEYNLTTHYFGLGDISAASLNSLADSLTNSYSQSFAKYYRANSVRYPTQPCEGICALNHYCAITRVDYREFRQCLETAASALASHSSALQTLSTPLFIFSIILFIFDLHKIFDKKIFDLFKKYSLILYFIEKFYKKYIFFQFLFFTKIIKFLKNYIFIKNNNNNKKNHNITTTTKTASLISTRTMEKLNNTNKRNSIKTNNFHHMLVNNNNYFLKMTMNYIHSIKINLNYCKINFKDKNNNYKNYTECIISNKVNNICNSSYNKINSNNKNNNNNNKNNNNNNNNRQNKNLSNVNKYKIKNNNICQKYILANNNYNYNINIMNVLASDKIIITFRKLLLICNLILFAFYYKYYNKKLLNALIFLQLNNVCVLNNKDSSLTKTYYQ